MTEQHPASLPLASPGSLGWRVLCGGDDVPRGTASSSLGFCWIPEGSDDGDEGGHGGEKDRQQRRDLRVAGSQSHISSAQLGSSLLKDQSLKAMRRCIAKDSCKAPHTVCAWQSAAACRLVSSTCRS